jgi:hypothetical protein
MVRKYRNTLKAHAYALSSLGTVLARLAHEHRVVASAMEQRPSQGTRGDVQFSDWIAATAEVSAAAERLLELEVELARRHGLTWERVADALGVSRQSAWERFRTHSRWDRTHRLSRLRRVRRAAMYSRMALGQGEEVVAVLREMMRAGSAQSAVDSAP